MTAKKTDTKVVELPPASAEAVQELTPINMVQKLAKVQGDLVVKKDQKNTSMGGFKYRNAEAILEKAVQLASPLGCAITCSDELVQMGDVWSIKSTASFSDGESGIQCYGFGRIDGSHKSLCMAQLDGKASSYARKYALCGLLAVGNGEDADSDTKNESLPYQRQNYSNQQQETQQRHSNTNEETGEPFDDGGAPEMMYDVAQDFLKSHCKKHDIPADTMRGWISAKYEGKTLADMRHDDAILIELMARVEKECSSEIQF